MMNNYKKEEQIGIFTIVTIFLFMLASSAQAEPGVRPLGMGGAFVAVADDANSTYWNPAGIAALEKVELSYSGVGYERNDVRNDDHVAFVGHIFPETQHDWGKIGFYVDNSVDKRERITYPDLEVKAEREEDIFNLSYAKKIQDYFYLGANLRYHDFELTLTESQSLAGISYTSGDIAEDAIYTADIGMLYKQEKWSLGLLLRNLNKPDIKLYGVSTYLERDLRLGGAYRPRENILLTTDLAYIGNGNELRIGAEYWPRGWLGLRGGGYNITSKDDDHRAVTGGFSLRVPDKAYTINMDVHYTITYWYDMPSEFEDISHLFGLTFRF